MPTSTAFLRRGAGVLSALLAVSVLAVSPVQAADSAKPSKADKVVKEKKVESAAPKAAKTKSETPKSPKAPKPPKPPEKSREEQIKDDGVWAKGSNWMGLRAGYAKSTVQNTGDALVGYGMSYRHMMNRQWSFGGAVQHDLVGHRGASSEISVPFTLELARHFKWDTAIRPYVGIGGGYYWHKYYRTGTNDTGAPGSGGYVTVGFDLPLSDRHVLGLDTRVSSVSGRTGVANPVFGAEKASQTLVSVKLTWAMVY